MLGAPARSVSASKCAGGWVKCVVPTEEMTGRTPSQVTSADEPPGPDRGTVIGRFIVLDTLGSGGMGLVLLAYDPSLDRKVAIKLLRPDLRFGESSEIRTARLLREAQAMAKIGHRNVLQVYDVGMFEGQVFVAMEHIDGETLTSWLARPHGWREIAETFADAARGLHAAHTLGLVHRDFKPDNVLVARDGRVLVTDFGVVGVAATVDDDGAREPVLPSTGLTGDGAVVGTLGFIAPEQRAGKPVDARADQFAFCVALGRAVGKNGPRRLRLIAKRGLSIDPAARFPSMQAVAGALGRRSRALLLAGGVAVTAIVGGIVAAATFRPEPVAPCQGLGAKLAGVWDPAVRGRIHDAFVTTGKPAAAEAFERTAAALDDYAGTWVAMREDACLATAVRREQSPDLMDLRMACLDRRLSAASAMTQLFARADGDVVLRAAPAVLALEPVAGCADVDALRAAQPPPRDPARRAWVAGIDRRLDEATALFAAGKPKAAHAVASQLAIEARAAGHLPVRARAESLAATYLRNVHGSGAEQALADAMVISAAAHDDKAIAEDLATLVSFLSENGRTIEALALRPAGMAAAERAGDDKTRARVHWAFGVAFGDTPKYVEAETELRTALALEERASGPDSLALPPILADLAYTLNALRRLDEARPVAERGLAIVTKRVGADNPAATPLLNVLGRNAYLRDDYTGAVAAYEKMRDITAAAYGPESPRMFVPLNNLASALDATGHTDEALAMQERLDPIVIQAFGAESTHYASQAMAKSVYLQNLHRAAEATIQAERAVALYDKLAPDGNDVAKALAQQGILLREAHKLAECVPVARRVIAIREKLYPPSHSTLIDAASELGLCLIGLGRAAEALPLLERALAGEAAAENPRAPAHAKLTWALAQATPNPARARAYAEDSRDTYVKLGDREEAAEVEAWLKRTPAKGR